jgi:2,3-bisphosphoglycerate-independent phosphoglycerate mutase
MPPRSAENSLQKIEHQYTQLQCGRIASLIGRYYAMDRDNRWDRVQAAYDLLTQGKSLFTAPSAIEGLHAAYARHENDEFVKATCITSDEAPPIFINDGDSVIFMNFRADRARQLTRAFVHDDFDGFTRTKRPHLGSFVTLTEYAKDIKVPCAYPPDNLYNTIGEYLSTLGKNQLRIAETEKYAHVTFFFSGGREQPYPHEERILIASPNVATYDLKPEMSAFEVTDKLVAAITSGKFDFIVCNFANGDMVGHTGIFSAAVKAVEALDKCLTKIITALNKVNGQCLITADHGNVEQMSDATTGQAHTAHTCELVPCVYIGPQALSLKATGGTLADIAPTLLTLMQLPIPVEMTGHNLATFKN